MFETKCHVILKKQQQQKYYIYIYYIYIYYIYLSIDYYKLRNVKNMVAEESLKRNIVLQ